MSDRFMNRCKAFASSGGRVPLRSNVKTVVGSSLLWAWGFLCYLSSSLFPPGVDALASIGLEYGFFASQAAVVVFAVVVLVVSRRRRLELSAGSFLVAAGAISLTTVLLIWALQAELLYMVIFCGLVDGVCVTLMGVAWGARYSLGSNAMRPLIIVSFLLAYLVYLVIAHAPQVVSIPVVCLLPLCSWALWKSDASARHGLTSEVFPVKSDGAVMPGELTAGLWEARVLPWKPIGVLVAAAFIGNLMASVVMGVAYDSVQSLFYGGIVVCAGIATMALVPLTSDRNVLSVESVYRITLTFTAVGLVTILIFGATGVPIGGALVQGSAFFLQALVFLIITQSTQEQGLSPLLSFSVGQALVSAVVFVGNVVGKQIYSLFGSGAFVLDVVCGCGLLALFFMLVSQAGGADKSHLVSRETATPKSQASYLMSNENTSEKSLAELNTPANVSEVFMQQRVEDFAKSFGMTKRETEVFGYLARGRSLPYIADILFVTTGTIKTHTVHIYRKLEVNSKQELLDLFEASSGPRA